MSVYFVTCREANAVKIGSSNDPFARLGEIQWGCPMELVLEAVIDGSHEEEFALHRRFADDRLRGEWFTITPIIEAMMGNCPTPERPTKKLSRARPERPHQEPLSPFEKYQDRLARRQFKRRVQSGDIVFPFREPQALEDAQ